MKLIEKMAQEWWIKERDLSISGDPETYAPDPISFKAGFRAAREMALQCVLDGENIPNGSYTVDIEESIKSLGEAEA